MNFSKFGYTHRGVKRHENLFSDFYSKPLHIFRDKNMCQFVSMESAIWAESPPANGTFDSTKLPPYMTTHAARKQENYRKVSIFVIILD